MAGPLSSPGDARAWPVVGREGQLAAGLVALHSDDVSGIVLVGPAGTGKTRLARELAAETEHGGLGISIRTAETHLQRAFAKLGVNRRSELESTLVPGLDRDDSVARP
jgi:hypothetical protein